MVNFGNMLKQAQQMQTKMQEVQENLTKIEITGESGGGMVQVTLNGRGDMKKITIHPSSVEDIEILEDLIVAAHNNTKDKMEKIVSEETQKAMGGVKFPFKMPFLG